MLYQPGDFAVHFVGRLAPALDLIYLLMFGVVGSRQ